MAQAEQDKKDRTRIWRKLLEHRKKFMKLAAKQFIKDNPNYTYSLIDDYDRLNGYEQLKFN